MAYAHLNPHHAQFKDRSCEMEWVSFKTKKWKRKEKKPQIIFSKLDIVSL
jgi:hypothetical protein